MRSVPRDQTAQVRDRIFLDFFASCSSSLRGNGVTRCVTPIFFYLLTAFMIDTTTKTPVALVASSKTPCTATTAAEINPIHTGFINIVLSYSQIASSSFMRAASRFSASSVKSSNVRATERLIAFAAAASFCASICRSSQS